MRKSNRTPFSRTLGLALVCALVLAAAPVFAAEAPAAKGVVNINSADAAQLALLPRVGPAVAERILEHRKSAGPFKTLEDLMLVRGIGEKTFALMKPYLSLSGQTTLSQKVKAPRPAAAEPSQP
jgi:competence protein ComEA